MLAENFEKFCRNAKKKTSRNKSMAKRAIKISSLLRSLHSWPSMLNKKRKMTDTVTKASKQQMQVYPKCRTRLLHFSRFDVSAVVSKKLFQAKLTTTVP